MPEQLTKHPEVTLQVLRSAGARCGEGAQQEILTACPAEGFCKLPGGEICVHGLADAARMTQISPLEWQATLRSLALQQPAAAPAPGGGTAFEGSGAVLAGGGLLLGIAIGWALSRWRGGRR